MRHKERNYYSLVPANVLPRLQKYWPAVKQITYFVVHCFLSNLVLWLSCYVLFFIWLLKLSWLPHLSVTTSDSVLQIFIMRFFRKLLAFVNLSMITALIGYAIPTGCCDLLLILEILIIVCVRSIIGDKCKYTVYIYIRKYGSIFYVRMGQIQNGHLYLIKYGNSSEKTTVK